MEAIGDFINQSPRCRQGTILAPGPVAAWLRLRGSGGSWLLNILDWSATSGLQRSREPAPARVIVAGCVRVTAAMAQAIKAHKSRQPHWYVTASEALVSSVTADTDLQGSHPVTAITAPVMAVTAPITANAGRTRRLLGRCRSPVAEVLALAEIDAGGLGGVVEFALPGRQRRLAAAQVACPPTQSLPWPRDLIKIVAQFCLKL